MRRVHIVRALERFSTADLASVAPSARILSPILRPLDRSSRVCGVAVTVATGRGDNLALHRALAAAPPGSVLVARSFGTPTGLWGLLMTRAAIQRGLRGLITDGYVRDAEEIRSTGWPVFARGCCPRQARKQVAGKLGVPLKIAGTLILDGDLIVGDADGIVCLPRNVEAGFSRPQSEQVGEIANRAADRRRVERRALALIRRGALPLEALKAAR